MLDQEAFLGDVVAANQEIYRLLNSRDEALFAQLDVGAGGDVSYRFDLEAEKIFVAHLGRYGKVVSEESGEIGKGEYEIILDPVDGSSNYLSGFPYYGTSVALIDSEGLLVCALICNLCTKELFLKYPSKPLLKSQSFDCLEFNEVVASKQSKVGLFEKAYAHSDITALLDKRGLKIRTPGAVALSLAYAHEVMFVLFVGEFRIFDFAAGLAMCEGLEVVVEQDYVIVSKSKMLTNEIKEALIFRQGVKV